MNGDLVVVGDVHLDHGDREVEPFCRAMENVSRDASVLILAGDLFNLWIAGNGPEPAHIGPVLETLRRIRSRGIAVRYLEGNRDYFLKSAYEGDVFDTVAERGLEESAGGYRIFAVHGDLSNRQDRQYRLWRRFSRSGPVRFGYRALPRNWRRRMSERIEGSMRATNLAYKRRFPEQEVREYADAYFRKGFDLVILGHFHLEKDLDSIGPGGGRILVLPEWKESRRYLRISTGGRVEFLDSG